MKTYKNHLTSTSNTKRKNLSNPVYRSSAIFPFILSNKLNTIIHYLSYWLIKRNIKEVNLLVTIRNKKGNIIKKTIKNIREVKSFMVNLKNEINFNHFSKLLTGSVELEVFSKEDLVYPYPAFVVNFEGVNSSSAVHTCGRIFNDKDDLASNNKFVVPETGFDVLCDKNYDPFFSFVNGKKNLKNYKLSLDLINHLGQKKNKLIKFKKIAPYETCFNFFLDKSDRNFYNNKKGVVKINHSFKSFFPRFLAGNFDKKKNNSSITHTYYDLSTKKDNSQYWINPNSKKYFDSSVAVPLFVRDNLKTEIAIYPNFSKSIFNLNLQIFDQQGKKKGFIRNFFRIDHQFKSIKYLDLNQIIKSKNISLNKKNNYFCRIYLSYKDKILTRLKFGLNIGKANKTNSSFDCNICFNAIVPIKFIEKKRGTFKWGLLLNKNNSQILISNISNLKFSDKEANLNLKFWNTYNSNFLEKRISIPSNGNLFFNLNKEKKIKNFLKKNAGWMTIESDNPFINGWYLDISKNGSVGADHLF